MSDPLTAPCGHARRSADRAPLPRQECLPRALLATVRSFSAGANCGDGDDSLAMDGDGQQQLVPLIVQAMARIAEIQGT